VRKAAISALIGILPALCFFPAFAHDGQEHGAKISKVQHDAARAPGAANSSAKPAPPVKPLWSELRYEQQQALSPLASEWDKLDATQKKKWLAIGNKYSSMKPDQQIRLQERMRDWVKLTPEQRRAARENYARSKKLDSNRKSAGWEQYQQLPEEQKKKLAAEAAARKRVTNIPPPSRNAQNAKQPGPAKPAASAVPPSEPVPAAPHP